MEKLAGDLLLGLKFVRLEILSTSSIYFFYEKLGELRSRSLALKGLKTWTTSQTKYRVINLLEFSLNQPTK